MDINAKVANIVAQAPEWNFAGDCALLDLMKSISKNLHERGERTSQNLREFETNVRRVDIALDNATNSLRSLQFGQQFVEYRVEEVEDDDFIMPEDQKKKPEPPPLKSSQEMATEFLQNNLRMFRKNFEPVTLEVPDSDEDEGAANTTTVFRAKNPYDAIPLPYIIGSKEWQEHKYGGLYDSAENSEDEQPEQFSSSSSDEQETAAAPQPSPRIQPVESQLSDSSSLASLPKKSPMTKPATQPVVTPAARTKAQPRPIISSQRNPHDSDLFQALRASPPSDDPPSTSSSMNSSPAISQRHPSAHNLPRADHSLSSSSSSASKPYFPGRQSPPKLFDEPKRVAAPIGPPPIPTVPPINEESDAKPVAQIKRKPVNLFNDDEFNSFMSEIVDKVQSKTVNNSATSAAAKEIPKVDQVKPLETKETPARNLNLFDDTPPMSPNHRQQPAVVETPAKTLPTSLFDDNLDDDVDDFLSALTPQSKPQLSTPKNSLFDDDDDLDIDDIFAKNKKPSNQLASKTIAKTSLFDDDDGDNATDIFGSTSKPIGQPFKQQQEQKHPITVVEPPSIQRKSLFDDLGDDDLFGTPKSNKQLFVDPAEVKQEKKLEKKPQSGDILATPKKSVDQKEQSVNDQQKTLQDAPQTIKVTEIKSNKPMPKSDILRDDFSDEEPINIPSKDQHKKLHKTNDFPNPSQTVNPILASDLFSDDFKDEKPTKICRDQPKNLEKEGGFEDFSAAENEFKVTDVKTPNLIPKADLFNDDFSDEEPVQSSLLKQNDKAKATNEIKKPTEQKSKEIKTTAKTEKHFDQFETTNKNEKEDSNQAKEEKNPKESFEQEIVAQKEQDPLISLVADVTNKKSNTEMQTSQPPPAEDIAAAQQIMQNYSSLFSDEPPDDSEFFQTLGTSSLSSLSASKMFDSAQDFFEPNLPELPQSAVVTASEQPNKDYGGLRLFSDVPPEDDDDDNQETKVVAAPASVSVDASTKRIHTIFYDDFSETARAGFSQHQFGEQPPVDSDVVDKIAPKPSSPIKKLQMPNININVKALLPGGGTLRKGSKEQADASPDPPAATVTQESANRALKSSSSETDSILQCISKTRVRGPAHRRPSTRRARQENYAQSLLKEEPNEAASEVTESKPAQLPSVWSIDNDGASAKALTTSEKTDAPLKETQRITVTAKPSSFLDSDPEDDVSLFGKAPVLSSAAPAILPTQPSEDDLRKVSFLKEDNPPPAALPAQKPPKNGFQSMAKTPSFLDSDEEDQRNFLFRPQSESQPPFVSTTRANTGPPKSYVSFLDNNDDDDNFLFSAAAVEPSKSSKAESQLKKAPSKPSSFSDSEDDDELFKPATKSKSDVPLLLPVKKPINTGKQEPSELITKSKPQSLKASTSKLFDDSDDDDDDLFGSTAAPITKSQSKQAATPVSASAPFAITSQASLFDSSSEGEASPKSLINKSNLPVKPSKSLFSDDDDDDDDLFGSAAKSGNVSSRAKIVKLATRNVPKKAPNKITATPLPASGADNPLADLLGE